MQKKNNFHLLLLPLFCLAGCGVKKQFVRINQICKAATNPLYMAARRDSEQQIRTLVANDATLKDAQNMADALFGAIDYRNVGGVRALLDLGANPNTDTGFVAGQQWATSQAMTSFLLAAAACDINQNRDLTNKHALFALAAGKCAIDQILDSKSNGSLTTKSASKTNVQRTRERELAEAKKIFDMVATHPKTDLLKKTDEGLNIHLVATIKKAQIQGFYKAPKTREATQHVTQLLERELTKRGVKPGSLLEDAPKKFTKELEKIEMQGKKASARG